MRSGLKRVLAFLLTLTFVSMSMLNSFWAKYAKTFSVTDSLRVAFRRETVVHLPSGREMNTMFNPDTVKIVFGAMPSHLPSTAKLVDPANMSGYTMVPGAGQTNSTIQYVTGVSPVGFDPSDPSNDVYRINPALDDAAVYVFYDNISDTTYFVSRTSGIEYHFNEENEPDLVTGSTVEYNDFFYGLDDLEDIELKTGSSWDTSDVRTFHNFLSGCSSLSTAELAEIISFIDPSSAYSLAAMFEGLPLVTAVNISDWDLSTSEGVDISYMLSGMTSLTSIAFPTGAKKITLLSGNGIKRLFAGDTSLQTLNLSNLPYCATTNDSGTFNGCSSLETIFVAQDFVHSTVEPSESTFEGCVNLVGQSGTAFADEYSADPSAAVGKSFAYIDGRIVDGVRHYGYYSDGAGICTLTFNPNGGVSGETSSITEFTGTVVTIPASSVPTKGLDIFLGWGLSDTATDPVYTTGDTLTLNNSITLYAIYEATVYLKVGEELKTLINSGTKHIVYCREAELPDGVGAPIGTADIGGAGEIKVYYKDYTTYIASCIEDTRVVFEFNENSESLYEGKALLETISHTPSVRIDTSHVKRFRNMFKDCSVLQQNSLNAFLAEFDTSSAIQFNAMFSNVRVEYLDISSFNTSNVTDFSWMFQDMRSLKEINFGPGWDVSSADNHDLSYLSGQSGRNRCGLNDMFQRCHSLETLNISGWTLNQTSYVAAKEMFDECISLKTIYTDGSFDWTRIASSNCSNMFRRCDVIKGGNGTTLTSSHLSRDYARLDELGTPGYFTDASEARNARIDLDVFGGTMGTYDHINAETGVPVTISSEYTPTPPAGHTFAGWGLEPGGPVVCAEGGSVTVSMDTTLYAVYTNDTIITNATLKTGQAIASLLRSGTSEVVFGKMEDLPGGVVFEGNADVNDDGSIKAYYKSGTTYFIVDSFEPSVTIEFNPNCDGMFLSKYNLTRVRHTSGVDIDTSNVTTFRDMFKKCTRLNETSLNAFIADFDTSSAYQMNAMFSEVPVETLDISSFDTSGVTDFSYMFEKMTNLTTITFGPGWDVSSADNVTLAQGKYRCGLHAMFIGCTAIEEIDLRGWVLSTTTLVNAGEMFSGCTSLETIYCDSSSFDYDRIEGSTKDKDMFKDCTSLVGGNGTTFDSNHTNKEYARLDTAGTPGYFSEKNRGMTEAQRQMLNAIRDGLEILGKENIELLEDMFGKIDPDDLTSLDKETLKDLRKQINRLLLKEEAAVRKTLESNLENLSKENLEILEGLFGKLDADSLDSLDRATMDKINKEIESLLVKEAEEKEALVKELKARLDGLGKEEIAALEEIFGKIDTDDLGSLDADTIKKINKEIDSLTAKAEKGETDPLKALKTKLDNLSEEQLAALYEAVGKIDTDDLGSLDAETIEKINNEIDSILAKAEEAEKDPIEALKERLEALDEEQMAELEEAVGKIDIDDLESLDEGTIEKINKEIDLLLKKAALKALKAKLEALDEEQMAELEEAVGKIDIDDLESLDDETIEKINTALDKKDPEETKPPDDNEEKPPDADTGQGNETGNGTETGQGDEAGNGTETGQGNETENGSETGQGNETENGTETGQGNETENGSETGQGNETENGSETGQGNETENGTETGQGNETENGTETGQGNETENGTEAGQGNETENGTETGQGNETENGSGTGQGNESGSGSTDGNPESSNDSGSEGPAESGGNSENSSAGGSDSGESSGSESSSGSSGSSESKSESSGSSDSNSSSGESSGSGSKPDSAKKKDELKKKKDDNGSITGNDNSSNAASDNSSSDSSTSTSTSE